MATDSTIEGRLEAVEEAIEEWKRKVEGPPPGSSWRDHFIATFRDEPAFEEVIRLGQESRAADRPSSLDHRDPADWKSRA